MDFFFFWSSQYTWPIWQCKRLWNWCPRNWILVVLTIFASPFWMFWYWDFSVQSTSLENHFPRTSGFVFQESQPQLEILVLHLHRGSFPFSLPCPSLHLLSMMCLRETIRNIFYVKPGQRIGYLAVPNLVLIMKKCHSEVISVLRHWVGRVAVAVGSGRSKYWLLFYTP